MDRACGQGQDYRTSVRPIGLVILVTILLLPGACALPSPPSAAQSEAYNQSKALEARGRYTEAIPFARRALKLAEQEFGPDHPTTAQRLSSLASLYHDLGRHSEAEPLYRRAVAIYERVLRRMARIWPPPP